MKVSSAALALLLTGTTTAFVPTLFHVSKSVNHDHSSTLFAHVNRPKFPTPKVTSDTPISTDSQYLKNIMEARYCLLEIETAAEKAREYLEYMEEVSQVIRQFLGGNAPSIQLPENVQDAHEYLNNIEKATASALEYLQYLEDMAVDIKGYLQTFQQEYEKGAGQEHFQKAQEAKAYFDSLEETAASARDYLTSLQEVATVVEGYLQKLKIAQMPQLLSAEEARATRVLQPNELPFPPLEQVVDPNMTTPPTKRVEPVTVAKPPPPPPATSSGSYLDSIASMDSIAAARPSGSGPRSYLDTMARPSSTTTGGSGGPRGYLDNISNATPTSHFKESADSTPFAQAGPPEKGRSDVSHMDTYDLQTPAVVEDVGPTSVDGAKAPPPPTTAAAAPPAATTTKSYLDQMSSSSASSKPAAATTGSYLDQMSKSSSSKRAPVGKKAGPTSYLDSMTRGSGRPTKKAVPKKGPTSYLDTMSAAGATSSKRGPTSYLDQVSKTPATPIDWSQAKATTGSMPPPAAATTTMRPQGSMPPPAAAAAAAARRAPTVVGDGGSMPRPASRAATQSVSQKPRATSPYGNRMTPPKPTKKLVIDWAQAKARQAANSKAASSSAPRPTAGRGMAVKPDPLHSSKGPVQANPRAHSQQRPTRRIAAWPKGTRPSRRVTAAAPPQKPTTTQAGPRPTRTMIRPQKPAAPTLPIRPDANVRATRRTTSPARPTRRMPIRPSRPVPKRATKLTGAAASYLESMSAPPPAAAAAATTRRSPPKQQKAPGSTLPRSPYQPNPNAADSSRRPAKQQEGNGKKARPNFEWMF
jgi:hypothetical protein